jgi:hypothetical protein
LRISITAGGDSDHNLWVCLQGDAAALHQLGSSGSNLNSDLKSLDSSNGHLRTGTEGSKSCSTQKVKTMAKAKQQPVHEIRLGAIKAAIWENQTTAGTRHNVTVCRVYKDGDEWKQTESFGRDDLPLLAKVLDRAHSWIFDEAA